MISSSSDQLNRTSKVNIDLSRTPAAADASADTSSTTTSSNDVASLPFTKFVWGAGVECSFLPHLNVDQFDWTQHNRFWRDDLKRAKEELGINTLRYAFPWHKLENSPGQFDFSFADERV